MENVSRREGVQKRGGCPKGVSKGVCPREGRLFNWDTVLLEHCPRGEGFPDGVPGVSHGGEGVPWRRGCPREGVPERLSQGGFNSLTFKCVNFVS